MKKILIKKREKIKETMLTYQTHNMSHEIDITT